MTVVILVLCVLAAAVSVSTMFALALALCGRLGNRMSKSEIERLEQRFRTWRS